MSENISAPNSTDVTVAGTFPPLQRSARSGYQMVQRCDADSARRCSGASHAHLLSFANVLSWCETAFVLIWQM